MHGLYLDGADVPLSHSPSPPAAVLGDWPHLPPDAVMLLREEEVGVR
jgi:hypothetical protein